MLTRIASVKGKKVILEWLHLESPTMPSPTEGRRRLHVAVA